MSNLREALLRMMPEQNEAFMSGKVVAIDVANCTCDINPDNGDSMFFDVRLRSQINENSSGIVVFPKIDSSVIFGMIDANSACVLLFTEIEKVSILGTNMSLTANIEADGGISLNVLGKVNMTIGASGISFGTSENINLQGKNHAESAETINSSASNTNTVQSSGNMNVAGQTTNIDASVNTNINAGGQIVLAGGSDLVATANRVMQQLNLVIGQVNSLVTWANTHAHAANATPPTVLFTNPNLNLTSQANFATSKVRIP